MARIRLIEDLGELVGSFIASSETREALGIDARDAAPEYVTGIQKSTAFTRPYEFGYNSQRVVKWIVGCASNRLSVHGHEEHVPRPPAQMIAVRVSYFRSVSKPVAVLIDSS
jgi:hypothetical protein